MRFIYFSIILLLTFSCSKKREKASWKPNIIFPVANATLKLDNIIKDGSLIKEDSDKGITFVHKQELANITLDTMVKITTPPFEKTVKLSSLVLDTKTFSTRISLRNIADQLIASGTFPNTFIGNTIKSSHGSNAAIPALSNLSAGPSLFDLSDFFEEAEVNSGNLNINIENGLPVTVSNIDLDLKNKSINPSTSIISANFTNIAKNGGSINNNYDLANKTIEGQLNAIISNLSTNAESNVLIDTTDAITITLTLSGITVKNATAVFPAQDVVNNTDVIVLEDMDDILATKAIIKSGTVNVEVVSTAQDQIYFTYNIPSATKDGNTFTTQTVVPAALPGKTSSVSFDYDFSGYTLDLRGQTGTDFNTFVNSLNGRIEYTGNKVYLSLDDSIKVIISTKDVIPSYVQGYLGNRNINIGPEVQNFDFFNKITGGSINFESINLLLSIENNTGIPASGYINEIKTSNKLKNISKTLTSNNVKQLIPITKATDNPLIPSTTSIDLSSSNNSNITELISILPNQINYDMIVETNPNGNDNSYSDFIYTEQGIKANLEMEMPLSIDAKDIVITDTLFFDHARFDNRPIKKAKFVLVANNGFPIDANIDIHLLNYLGTNYAQYTTPTVAKAGLVDENTGRVYQKTESVLEFEMDEKQTFELYNAYFVKVIVKFNTAPTNQFLKIYSDQEMDINLVADIIYLVD